MAEFVVGTGGRNLRGFKDTKPNSEVRWNDSFGVLGLTLYPDGYDWRFHGTPEPLRSTRAAPPADEHVQARTGQRRAGSATAGGPDPVGG